MRPFLKRRFTPIALTAFVGLAAALVLISRPSSGGSDLSPSAYAAFDPHWIPSSSQYANAVVEYEMAVRLGNQRDGIDTLKSALDRWGTAPESPLIKVAIAISMMASNRATESIPYWTSIITVDCKTVPAGAVGRLACRRALYTASHLAVQGALSGLRADAAGTLCRSLIDANQQWPSITLPTECAGVLASLDPAGFEAAYRLTSNDEISRLHYLEIMTALAPELGHPGQDLEALAKVSQNPAITGHAWYLRATLEPTFSSGAIFYTAATRALSRLGSVPPTTMQGTLEQERFDALLHSADNELGVLEGRLWEVIVQSRGAAALQPAARILSISEARLRGLRLVFNSGKSGWSDVFALFAGGHRRAVAARIAHISCLQSSTGQASAPVLQACVSQRDDMVSTLNRRSEDECHYEPPQGDAEKANAAAKARKVWFVRCGLAPPASGYSRSTRSTYEATSNDFVPEPVSSMNP
jgi:hypothetical protein